MRFKEPWPHFRGTSGHGTLSNHCPLGLQVELKPVGPRTNRQASLCLSRVSPQRWVMAPRSALMPAQLGAMGELSHPHSGTFNTPRPAGSDQHVLNGTNDCGDWI